MRPMTSTSADFMSVPIANVRNTWLPPELALPLTSSTPGRPCSTCSCGSSSSASTSSGEAPRQLVKMGSSAVRCRESRSGSAAG
jgi:hypothetical protein